MSSSCSEADAAFIAEHGRLRRPIDHSAFDAFRRRTIKVPFLSRLFRTIIACLLLPIRFLILFTVVPFCWLLTFIFGPTIVEEDLFTFKLTIVPPWRLRILQLIIKATARAILFTLGFWRVHGADAPGFNEEEAQKATIISNHTSMVDPCILSLLFRPAFVAKKALWNVPFVGRIGACLNAMYIDRVQGSKVSATECMAERVKFMQVSKVPFPPICIFPEGTTTNGNYLMRFKKGAFVGGGPIAPVLIRYPFKYFSPTYESIKTLTYIKGILLEPYNQCDYWRMPVYYPNEEEKNDARLYADNIAKLMIKEWKEHFGYELQLTESSYIDKMEYHSVLRRTPLKKGIKLRLT